MYSVEAGLVSFLIKYEELPIYPTHPNTLPSDNLLKVMHVFSNGLLDAMPIFLYNWDAYVGINFKKELTTFEKTAIFSKEAFDIEGKEPPKRKTDRRGNYVHCVVKIPKELILKHTANKVGASTS